MINRIPHTFPEYSRGSSTPAPSLTRPASCRIPEGDSAEDLEALQPIREVHIDELAVLHILKHGDDNFPSPAADLLLGLDIKGVIPQPAAAATAKADGSSSSAHFAGGYISNKTAISCRQEAFYRRGGKSVSCRLLAALVIAMYLPLSLATYFPTSAPSSFRPSAAPVTTVSPTVSPTNSILLSSENIFNYTGNDVSVIVPEDVYSVHVYMWGAGGALYGGAGAYVEGDLAVTPNEQLVVMVGQGGQQGKFISAYGGGGGGNNGGGGGRSAVRRGGEDIVTAGGGGGSYGGAATSFSSGAVQPVAFQGCYNCPGAMTTSCTGNNGGGGGGSQTSGGVSCTSGSEPGSKYQGGNTDFGGGGGGYYGGGAGYGGGGSSFLSNLINFGYSRSGETSSGICNADYSNYFNELACGGGGSGTVSPYNGQNGRVVITLNYFGSAFPSVTPSASPTVNFRPTYKPAEGPTYRPTITPTQAPTCRPTVAPTQPTGQPTSEPINPTGEPSGQPSAAPSFLCPMGYFYTASEKQCRQCPYPQTTLRVNSDVCALCRPGQYFTNRSIVQCHDCTQGSYSAEAQLDTCQLCPLGRYTLERDVGSNIACDYYGFHTLTGVALYIVFITLVVFLSVFFIRQPIKHKLAALVLLLLPTFDFVSDCIYLMYQIFYNIYTFAACGVLLFFPAILFGRELSKKQLYPRAIVRQHARQFLWLWHEEGSPAIRGQRSEWDFEHHDSAGKVIYFLLLWSVLMAAQLVSLIAFPLLYLIDFVFISVMYLFGFILFQTKVLTLNHAWNKFITLWSGAPTAEQLKDESEMMDFGLFNRALFAEFVTETTPQLVLQSINNTYTYQWSSLITIASVVMSCIVTADGLWNIVYWKFIKGVKFDAIPISLAGGFQKDGRQKSTNTEMIHNVLVSKCDLTAPLPRPANMTAGAAATTTAASSVVAVEFTALDEINSRLSSTGSTASSSSFVVPSAASQPPVDTSIVLLLQSEVTELRSKLREQDALLIEQKEQTEFLKQHMNQKTDDMQQQTDNMKQQTDDMKQEAEILKRQTDVMQERALIAEAKLEELAAAVAGLLAK